MQDTVQDNQRAVLEAQIRSAIYWTLHECGEIDGIDYSAAPIKKLLAKIAKAQGMLNDLTQLAWLDQA